MSHNNSFFGPSLTSSVTLSRARVFPGTLLEGYAALHVLRDTTVRNVHLKIVGKEQVHAMVDQVAEADNAAVPFGTVSQDFVYYREIVTIAGDLLTRPRRSNSALSSAQTNTVADTDPDEVAYQETHLANTSFAEATAAARSNNNSVLISLAAAASQQHVVIPSGEYVYPFSFALPEELPPTYHTGVQLKNGDQSRSRAQLVYYVKLYLIGVDGKELDTSSADFTVLPMQPSQPNRTFIGCMQHRLRDDCSHVEVRFPAADTACGAFCGGGGGSGAGGGKANGKHQLAVRLALKSTWLTLNKDRIEVSLTMHNKTAKAVQGARLTLVQRLTFRTAKADVETTRTVLSAECQHAVGSGQEGTIVVQSASAPVWQDDLMPTMSTSGLIVQYDVSVELLARHLVGGSYTFESVVLAAAGDPELGEPPCGELAFSALPRGHLTRREAYYAVPQAPCTTPALATLHVSS